MLSKASSPGTSRRIVIVATAMACLVATDTWIRHLRPTLQDYCDNPYPRIIANQHPMPNIVLMGSSRSLCSLVPDEFKAATGKKVVNAAINGAAIVEWQLVARQLFANEQPDLVVLGINAHELRGEYTPLRAARHLFTFFDLLDYLQRDQPSMEIMGGYFRHLLGPSWALFDQRYELKMWAQEQLPGILPRYAQKAHKLREQVTHTFKDGSYEVQAEWVQQLPTLADRLSRNPNSVTAFSPPTFSRQANTVAYLAELLDWFKAKNIAVLVVYLPNSPITEERWREIEPAMTETISQVCREHRTPFLACAREEVPRTNADFIDEFHTGVALARRISRRAAQRINALGLLDKTSPYLAETFGTENTTP